ncbi:helix-turn-helix transcriptional regulator [Streptomyces sp. NPDC007157]|uniref:helix-turn-helix domain-containing protein n=1 Tax=Streptomyces sp. NPDC007157 TaxID=3154681 RepID=UPI0033D14EC5
MRRPPALPNQPGPPFNAPAARRLRTALGMGPEHVAHHLRVSYGLPYATPDLVLAWERGALIPSSPELTALSGVLWCSPGELIGRPRTLRDHRVARGLAPEDVALAVGLELLVYLAMEEDEQWQGTERQSAALADLLRLSLPDYITVTGREEKLAELLRSAVTTRWQAYVRPVTKVVPLDRRLIEHVLRGLHEDYQGRMTATLAWGPPTTTAEDAKEKGEVFLTGIVPRFWNRVEDPTP